jgi:hypothetical protein
MHGRTDHRERVKPRCESEVVAVEAYLKWTAVGMERKSLFRSPSLSGSWRVACMG